MFWLISLAVGVAILLVLGWSIDRRDRRRGRQLKMSGIRNPEVGNQRADDGRFGAG